MDRMRKYVMGCLVFVLAACNKSYPGLYAPVIDEDNPNPEVTADRVPIKLSATDPAFSIVTRGHGPFDDWSEEENRDRWRVADFYIYAFLARNHEFSGSVNYASEEVNFLTHNDDGRIPYCLVKNRKARINGAPEPTLEWVPENTGEEYQPYYSVSYPDYMFNFFLYHIDNAEQHGWVAESTRVYCDIEVDGTQDIISGYAHATEENLENVGDNDESRYLWNNWQRLIYSARAGHRQIHPRFYLRHEMARLKFQVKGLSPENSDKIKVMAIGVKARYRGIFTVARDWGGGWSWSEDAEQPQIGVEWNPDRNIIYVATEQTPKEEFGATFDLNKCRFEPLRSVGYNQSEDLGEILLPPDESYSIYIKYKMTDYPDAVFTATYSDVGFAEAGRYFEANHVYEVTLSVYGMQSIGLEIDNSGLSWNAGGSLDVDKGEDF